MPLITDQLGDDLARLRAADPQAYLDLINHLSIYNHELMAAVAQAEPGEILVCQGRAQQSMKFLQIAMECEAIARKLARKPAP